MNKEEILNDYIKLIDKGYCEDCNELNCIGNFPHKDIAKAICDLQLKNTLLQKQNQKYKEVIDETIEYIEGAYEMALYTKTVSLEEENIEELLDILKEVE